MNINTPSSSDLLSKTLEDDNGLLVRRIWPEDKGAGSLREALREAGSSNLFDALLRHLRLMDADLPIVAVAGLLNAGKSSTVATFLSSAGRQRVLCGVGTEEATHRFVLWCPRSWERDELRRAALLEVLGNVFGAAVEPLSEDPAAAHRQYNCQDGIGGKFNIPLVAFDEGLDGGEFAILDCPDVERPLPNTAGTHTSQFRLEVLKKASSIASYLLMIASHAGVSAENFANTVRKVLAEMPGIPWWLLLNMAETKSEPHAVLKDCATVVSSLEPRAVFVAFNFGYDLEKWRSRTPAPLHYLKTEDDKLSQPAFYLVESDPARNPPNAVDDKRFLSHLPQHFTAEGGVGQRLRVIHTRGLIKKAQNAENEAIDFCGATRQQARKLWEELLRVCTHAFTDSHGELKVPATPETTERLRAALVKSAPLASRMALHASTGILKIKILILSPVSLYKKLKKLLTKEGTENARQVPAKLDATMFMEGMIRAGFAVDALPTEKERIKVWNEVLARFENHQPAKMNEKELEDAMAEVWKLRNKKPKAWGLVGPISLVLILLAFGLAPLDGGATLTLFLTKLGIPSLVSVTTGGFLATQIVGFLSVSEILIAFGAFASLAPVGGFLIEKMMRKQLALPALSNLFACACDAFGLPRRIGSEPTVTIQRISYSLPPAIAERGPAGCALLKSSVWEFQPEGWRELKAQTEALSTDAQSKLAAHLNTAL